MYLIASIIVFGLAGSFAIVSISLIFAIIEGAYISARGTLLFPLFLAATVALVVTGLKIAAL